MRLGSWAAAAKEACRHSKKLFAHRGRAVTKKERDVVRGNRSKEESVTGLLVCFFFEFCRSVSTSYLSGMSGSLRFKRAVVFVFLVQKAESWLDFLSNESFAMAGRSGFSSSSAVRVDFFKSQTHQIQIQIQIQIQTQI